MRTSGVEEDLGVRVPSRSPDFDDGVEVGVMAGLMATRIPRFSRTVNARVIGPIKALAAKLGYRVVPAIEPDGRATVTVEMATIRPTLRLV